jgi:hypothetical protein
LHLLQVRFRPYFHRLMRLFLRLHRSLPLLQHRHRTDQGEC